MISTVKIAGNSRVLTEIRSEPDDKRVRAEQASAHMGGEKVIRKRIVNAGRKTAAVLLVLALSAGLFGCGGKDASQKASAEESTAAGSTVLEPINPEEVKSEDVIKEEEKPAVAATQKDVEKEVIEKPEPTEVDPEAEREAAERKKEENEKRKQDNSSAVDLNEVLDGVMSLDGMQLEFPVELSSMKLGKWTLTYEVDGNPADKTMAPDQVVTAKMTSPDYTDDDVIVKAEFGNYTGSEAKLTDLPMTGIYITKGKGKDGAEPKLPELEIPCGFTWGTPESVIHEQLGEASFSGSFGYDFDFMYENGKYLLELGGMSDTGLEYIVYSVE